MPIIRRTPIVGEPPQRRAAFRIVAGAGGEEIRVPAKRGWRLLPFHTTWQLFWTLGGLTTFYRLAAHPDLPNLAMFCLALLCCLGIIAALAWMAVGEEVIRLAPGRLEIGYRLLGVERMRSYPVAEIDGLGTWDDNPATDPAFPIASRLAHGAVKFETAERTVFCAASVGEADAQRLVDHLRRRLPTNGRETAYPLRQLFW